MLEHLSIYTYLIVWITFSISMYIMCVCLFSASSHRVGALQISIIIIKRSYACQILFLSSFVDVLCCSLRGAFVKNVHVSQSKISL